VLICTIFAASVQAAPSTPIREAKRVLHAERVLAVHSGTRRATFDLGHLSPWRLAQGRLIVLGRGRDVALERVRAGARRGELRLRFSAEQRVAVERRPGAARRSKPALKLLVRRRPAPYSSPDRLYSDASPWNVRIPRGWPVDPRSETMVESLRVSRAYKGFPLSVREWTVPTYFADASTPRRDVGLRRAPPSWTEVYGTPRNFIGPPPGWITDPTPWAPRLGWASSASPTRLLNVPIPRGARPDSELDAHMTVIDRSTGCEYDFYAAHKGPDGWQALWANSTRTGGTGVYPYGLSSKASGFAGGAGLVWPEELRAGRIDHALFMSFPFTKAGGPVAPATSSDGRTARWPASIPIGARIQLDPKLKLGKLGLKPYERTVARALQRYGMIVGDTGGAMGLFAVHPKSYGANPYEGVLPNGPYAYLNKIPVNRFRVLKLPPQRTNLSLRLFDSGCGQLK
jgi:hypothetical protein